MKHPAWKIIKLFPTVYCLFILVPYLNRKLAIPGQTLLCCFIVFVIGLLVFFLASFIIDIIKVIMQKNKTTMH